MNKLTPTFTSKLKAAPGRIIGVVFLCIVAFFAFGYIVLPIVQTAATSVNWDASQIETIYQAFLLNNANISIIFNTLAVGGWSTLTCGVLGIALAIFMRYFCHRGRRLMQVLLIMPVMIPGVVVVVAFLQLYGESGMLTTILCELFNLDKSNFSIQGLFGIVLVITYTQYVYFYLNVYSALGFVDANSVEQVKSLGGGKFKILKDAIFPVVGPAIVLSAVTTFISAIGSYSAPALLGGKYRVLSTQIVVAKTNFDMQLASTEVMVLFAIGMAALVAGAILRRVLATKTNAKAVIWAPDTRHMRIGGALFKIFTIVQISVVALPVATVFYLSAVTTESILMQAIPTAFTWDNYIKVFTNPRTFQPLYNSICMSAIAVVIGLVAVVPTVMATRKHKKTPAVLIKLALALPWCMPASVIAIDLINVLKEPTIFSFGRALIGTYEILPIAYAVMSLPLILNSTQLAVDGIRENIEDAAKSLGSGSASTFTDIVLPAIIPAIMSGAILCFVRSMGEYTMSALLYGVFNRPLSVSIVTNMQEYEIGVSMAYGVLLILTCSVLLGIVFKFNAASFGIDVREHGKAKKGSNEGFKRNRPKARQHGQRGLPGANGGMPKGGGS